MKLKTKSILKTIWIIIIALVVLSMIIFTIAPLI